MPVIEDGKRQNQQSPDSNPPKIHIAKSARDRIAKVHGCDPTKVKDTLREVLETTNSLSGDPVSAAEIAKSLSRSMAQIEEESCPELGKTKTK